MVKSVLMVFMLMFASSAYSGNTSSYTANTGDEYLDAALVKLNSKASNKKRSFIMNLANEYQVPASKIETLIKIHEFTPADCFLTVAVADASGQSIEVVSRARIEHKDKDWKFIIHQLRIELKSEQFARIKKDVYLNFTH